MKNKQVVLSASTPSGVLTIGNYLGAISLWKEFSSLEFDAYYMVANLHSLTVQKNYNGLSDKTLSFFAQYLACGLDPKDVTLFVQSDVSAHSELCWILTCVTPLGNLQRMTQFKDKSQKEKSILAGLLTYPVLMAADILLYDTDIVPVGPDQIQHVELCRDIVEYFNQSFGDVFKSPKAKIKKEAQKIMSLTAPLQKMSKSDDNALSYISLLDGPDEIIKKFKRATTDSDGLIAYLPDNPQKAGVSNLLSIYAGFSGETIENVEKKFSGKLYGALKKEVAEVTIDALAPIQKKYKELISDTLFLSQVRKQGAEKAHEKANLMLKKVKECLGL